jgi:hypothetical protein
MCPGPGGDPHSVVVVAGLDPTGSLNIGVGRWLGHLVETVGGLVKRRSRFGSLRRPLLEICSPWRRWIEANTCPTRVVGAERRTRLRKGGDRGLAGVRVARVGRLLTARQVVIEHPLAERGAELASSATSAGRQARPADSHGSIGSRAQPLAQPRALGSSGQSPPASGGQGHRRCQGRGPGRWSRPSARLGADGRPDGQQWHRQP